MRSPYTQLYVHCVWATWDRQPLVVPAIEARLYTAITAKSEELKCEVMAIGGDLDHVHLLVRLSTAVSIAQLVKEVKGASSHLMNHKIARQHEFKWQGCYGAFSVSLNATPKVVDYVRIQKEHHANRRTFDEWEKCYEEIEA